MAKHKIHFHGPRNGHKRTTYIQQAQIRYTISKAHPKASARAYAKCSTQQGYIGNSVIYIKRHSSSPLENPTQPHYLPLSLSHTGYYLLKPHFHFALTSIFLHLDLKNRSGYLTISKTNPFFVLCLLWFFYFLGKEVILGRVFFILQWLLLKVHFSFQLDLFILVFGLFQC